jgi:hypothetical protein
MDTNDATYCYLWPKAAKDTSTHPIGSASAKGNAETTSRNDTETFSHEISNSRVFAHGPFLSLVRLPERGKWVD